MSARRGWPTLLSLAWAVLLAWPCPAAPVPAAPVPAESAPAESAPAETPSVATPAATPATGPEAVTTDTAEPDYLAELRELARKHLADGDDADATAVAPAARRVVGPISRQEYQRYATGADFSGTVEGDSVALTRPVVPRVVIRDRDAIGYLFDCCAYDEAHPDSIDFIEIYDFSRSGFSNGDMMVVHPSGHSYILDNLDVDFLDSAALWEQSSQLTYRAFHRETGWMDQVVEDLSPPETYDWRTVEPELTPADEEDQALRAIWGDLHRVVDQQYGRGPMELYFARDDTTTNIEFWGFDPADLDFRYLNQGAGGGNNDLLTVTVSDTLVTAYRTFVDILVVSDSRADTVFVPTAKD